MKNSKESNAGLNRRDFLKFGALTGLFAGASGVATACAAPASNGNFAGRAKYIIFMVSDGMSHGTLQMADLMSRRKHGRPSKWIELYEQRAVTRGLMDMTTGNASVPDSAAAASSWGCGHRITNGNVNMDDNGNPFEPLIPIFGRNGRKTGLVTTTEVTHATPAGFTANVQRRGMQDDIAMQYLEREVDVILGGGSRHFDPEVREDGRDLFAGFRDKGYKVARTKAGLGQPNGFGRVIGTFTERHLPYSRDHENTEELVRDVPTLAEMSKYAIETLYASGDGFILQIEGGRVDHAAHSMDATGLIYDQIAFDDALRVAWDFYLQHPDETLIVFTTDHGNANPALNAAGSGYNDSDIFFNRIQNFTYTNNWIMRGLNEDSSVSDIVARVGTATGLDFERDHARMLQQALRGQFQAAYAMKARPMNVLGDLMSNYTAVAFTGSVHTADYVELAAAGPGSETLGPITRNTDWFGLMLTAAGIEVPAMRQG